MAGCQENMLLGAAFLGNRLHGLFAGTAIPCPLCHRRDRPFGRIIVSKNCNRRPVAFPSPGFSAGKNGEMYHCV